MFPVETTNFDIVASDSVTPTTDGVYNLGQDKLRWKFVYADEGRFSQYVEIGSITNRVRISFNEVNSTAVLDEPLILPRLPELYAEAAPKGYVDGEIQNHTHAYLPLTGGTLTGNITVPTQSVVSTDSTHPTDNQLVTKRITEDRYAKKAHLHNWVDIIGLTKPRLDYNTLVEYNVCGSDIVPDTNELLDLGKSNLRWKHVYTIDMEVEDDIKIGNDIRFIDENGANVCRLKYHPDGCEVEGHIFPDGDDVYDIGKPDMEWANVYSKSAVVSIGLYAGTVETDLLRVNSAISMNGNPINLIGAPVSNTDAVNKSYVDEAIAGITGSSGDWDSITGSNKPKINQTTGQSDVTVFQTDVEPFSSLLFSGSSSKPWLRTTTNQLACGASSNYITVADDLDMDSNRIVNVGTPTSGSDAATKTYVDDRVASVGATANIDWTDVSAAIAGINRLSMAVMTITQGGGINTSDSSEFMYIQLTIDLLELSGFPPNGGTYRGATVSYSIYDKTTKIYKDVGEYYISSVSSIIPTTTNVNLTSWTSSTYFTPMVKIHVSYELTVGSIVHTVDYGSRVVSFNSASPSAQSETVEF
ncbi:hypothetical protein TVWG_00014 [Tetraselmis viridis virus N1]|nr:hypothetical protein TVWG_00014 [Tetraselmis viridis virus N1]